MSGSQIASEVTAALREAGFDAGDGEFLVTLIKGQNDPQKPWDDGYYGEPDEHEIPALVQSYPSKMIDGSVIRVNDRKLMVAAIGHRPETSDKFKVAGTVYRVIHVKEVSPFGVPLYFECQVRV